MAEKHDQAKQFAKIVAKTWADEDYKQRLVDDPASVLAEEGIEVPAGKEIKVLESTENKMWLVLPPKPEGESIDESTERLAAIEWKGCCICFCAW